MQYDRFNLHPGIFEKVCRTCLSDGDMNNIFEVAHAADVLSGFLSLNVTNGDTSPQNICNSCLEQISNIHNFAKRCREVEDTLKLILDECCIKNDETEEEALDFIKLVCVVNDEDLTQSDETNADVKNEPYSCKFCEAVFVSEEELRIHKEEANHPKIINRSCPVCQKTFRGPYCLRQHMRSHTKEKPYKCNVCPATFTIPGNLSRHRRLHGRERPYICEICGKGYIQLSTLNQHKKVHSDEKPYMCNYCGKSFRSNQTFQRHLMQHKIENGELTQEEQMKQLERHKCKICERILLTKSGLITHLQTHGEKMYLCTHCGKGFFNKGALTSHTRVHTGEKPYKCRFCEKTFGQTVGLISHEMIHTGKKPHKCNYCPKAFVQQQQLTYHLRTHTGERPYTCKYCGKSFRVKGNLTVHTRLHTSETPYHCPVCNKGFYDSSSMKKHHKRHGNVNKLTSDQGTGPDI